jgi:hypothetical protein
MSTGGEHWILATPCFPVELVQEVKDIPFLPPCVYLSPGSRLGQSRCGWRYKWGSGKWRRGAGAGVGVDDKLTLGYTWFQCLYLAFSLKCSGIQQRGLS